MPEGPEVRLFVDNINKHFKNKTIKIVRPISGRFIKKPVEMINNLSSKVIENISCKGKFIWFEVEELVIFNTLGMTGSWSRNKTDHTRIEIHFIDTEDILYFNDIRSFGTFQVKNKNDLHKKLKSIGPDMLSLPPTSKEFIKILRKRNVKNICDVLMNQNNISGIGNYIKAESLWLSCINPFATIENLTDDILNVLYYAVLFVIRSSYASQGATLQTYYTFDNEKGEYGDFLYVYGKRLDYNGFKIIKVETPDKRTTHYVKERQTLGVK